MSKQHKHDCDDCEYLGSIMDLDLYTCEHGPGRTFVARYGSGGPDYTSFPVFALGGEVRAPRFQLLQAVGAMYLAHEIEGDHDDGTKNEG